MKFPTDFNGRWSQTNISDKFDSLAYSKNINLDRAGYIKLSPRTVRLHSDVENADFGIPVGVGRFSGGAYQVATASDANFTTTIEEEQNSWNENSGASEPTLTIDSHAVWFKGLWHATTATGVFHRPATGGASQAWTSASISLTSGKRHILCVFQSSSSLCVSNGNTVLRYTEATGTYTLAATLTIPTDYEIVGLAYNKQKIAVATRLSNDGTDGQDQEVRLFIWNGAATPVGGDDDPAVGSDACMDVVPYKSSFALFNRAGQLLYWNGGGFDQLAALPIYYMNKIWNSPLNTTILGSVSMVVDGDVIYINLGLVLNTFGVKSENTTPDTPSGAWCFDPQVGLYHRWSPSVSPAYVNFVSSANINTSTDTLTASAGVFGLETIPATGNVARLTTTAGIGGLALNNDYYIIRVSSTDFKLATTKANALDGTAIDITSATAGDNYFWMYDLVDYGNTYYSDPSVIGLTGDTTAIYQDVIFGGRLALTTTLGTNDAICIAVPFLENRGYFVTPKIFSGQVTDNNQKLFIKFRPLKSTDSIIIKYRDRDIIGLPVTSSGDEAIWSSPSAFSTIQDLSEAKTYLDAGKALECEFISGAGGGAMVQISTIDTDDNITYSVTLAESVLGAATTLLSEYIIHNWEVKRTITSADDGFVEIPISGVSKFAQFKIELRGSDVTIEELEFISAANKRSV